MNVAVTRAAEGFPRRAFSVDDVRRMIDAGVIREDENVELIEGELVRDHEALTIMTDKNGNNSSFAGARVGFGGARRGVDEAVHYLIEIERADGSLFFQPKWIVQKPAK